MTDKVFQGYRRDVSANFSDLGEGVDVDLDYHDDLACLAMPSRKGSRYYFVHLTKQDLTDILADL